MRIDGQRIAIQERNVRELANLERTYRIVAMQFAGRHDGDGAERLEP